MSAFYCFLHISELLFLAFLDLFFVPYLYLGSFATPLVVPRYWNSFTMVHDSSRKCTYLAP